MKKILGLDLGSTSIGWALVNEAENEKEKSSIIKLGVRVNPLSTDEIQDFEKGKSLTINADRTLKRGARRNLQRFKLRRNNLIEVLKKAAIIDNNTLFTEDGKNTSYQTIELRAKAAKEKIEKEELARVFLLINKKRGYKSSRKTPNEEEGQAIDGMSVAIKLYEDNLTPGEFCLNLLKQNKKVLPKFYRSDLRNEFNVIWNFQKQFYPNVLDDQFYKALEGQGLQNTRKKFLAIKNIYTAENKGKREEKKIQAYLWRSQAINKQLDIGEVAYVFTEINNELNSSSDYLGAISDRSKELYFNKETVGQNLYNQIQKNPHAKLKGQVFYRQDYLDEFEKIWETQKQYHTELSNELKKEIRDITIFYQRRLKSQKGLIGFCELESKKENVLIDGVNKVKVIGARVCPKSSPIFQEFKIWQNISNIELKNSQTKQIEKFINFDIELKEKLFTELNIKGSLTKSEIFKILNLPPVEWDLNFSELQGNATNTELYKAYKNIVFQAGHELDFANLTGYEIKDAITTIFEAIGVDSRILEFNAELEGNEFAKQKSYQFWHLLYSYEGDKSATGNEALYVKLKNNFGFEREYAQYLMQLNFQDDYGNLSTKAIRKIFPFIKENNYSAACTLAHYNHSHSITKEENEQRVLKDKLELLSKNSLRNPVVEKILNQMVNVINTIIEDKELGKPDEIRIELARELKKNAKERAEMTQNIYAARILHDGYREILKNEFGILNPTRNDIIKYKLYKELEKNGYQTLYSNEYIPQEKLFSKEIDVEHIIPKARLFDDSFSNKTLEYRQVNLDKSDETAFDFIETYYGEEELENFQARIRKLFDNGGISKAKYKKLLMRGEQIGEGFIERDLRESQYIAKKAKQMLLEICRNVVPTTGSITDRLRNDWGLINVMKELNIEKYRALGLTEMEVRKEGKEVEKIIDWTKRNDHRHHAMDALTVAFTKHNHIQYLNNLNARKNTKDKKHSVIIAIENKETEKEETKRRFIPPISNFRKEAKRHLENVLISHKTKNKVVTRNKNIIKGNNSTQIALTPRGQLHKETVYGKSKKYATKMVKVGTGFDEVMIGQVANKKYQFALHQRLIEYNNNPKKAFGGKNSLAKNPIILEDSTIVPDKVKLVWLEENYTIRKDISPELKIEKVKDLGIRNILQKRLDEFAGKPKDAFVNLEKNPIWLNKDKGIAIKRVAISGVANAEALHHKKDHFGNDLLDVKGNKIASDFVSTGNNHHVAIYKDEKGNLQEEVVSLFEAVTRVNTGLSVVNREHEKGWEFLFTMKQNEMFVFPSDNFDPTEIDLFNTENYHRISPHLFRVQKIATKDYVFRHHLETKVEDKKELINKSYKRLRNNNALKRLIKVRINHLGRIVKIGEF